MVRYDRFDMLFSTFLIVTCRGENLYNLINTVRQCREKSRVKDIGRFIWYRREFRPLLSKLPAVAGAP